MASGTKRLGLVGFLEHICSRRSFLLLCVTADFPSKILLGDSLLLGLVAAVGLDEDGSFIRTWVGVLGEVGGDHLIW